MIKEDGGKEIFSYWEVLMIINKRFLQCKNKTKIRILFSNTLIFTLFLHANVCTRIGWIYSPTTMTQRLWSFSPNG